MSCEKRGGEGERRDGDKKATERGRGQKQTPLIRYPQTNGMTVIKTLYMESMSNCVCVCVCVCVSECVWFVCVGYTNV